MSIPINFTVQILNIRMSNVKSVILLALATGFKTPVSKILALFVLRKKATKKQPRKNKMPIT